MSVLSSTKRTQIISSLKVHPVPVKWAPGTCSRPSVQGARGGDWPTLGVHLIRKSSWAAALSPFRKSVCWRSSLLPPSGCQSSPPSLHRSLLEIRILLSISSHSRNQYWEEASSRHVVKCPHPGFSPVCSSSFLRVRFWIYYMCFACFFFLMAFLTWTVAVLSASNIPKPVCFLAPRLRARWVWIFP